jgi:LEA14-like dessication related protein
VVPVRTPTDIGYSWSGVSDDHSEIRAELSVPGANPIDVSVDALGVDLEVTMNDIPMASSRDERIRFARDRTALETRARIDHDLIPRWWASHVANGEQTSITIQPVVTVDGILGSFSLGVPGRTHDVETDIPGAIAVEDGPSKEVMGKTIVSLDEVTARWVDVDLETTEMAIAAQITNGTAVPLPFDELRYEIRMNGVTVGEGRSRDTTIEGHGTTRVDTRAAFDNETIREWWPTHLRRGERTDVTVDLVATVGIFGQQRTVDHRYEDSFETDLLQTR